MKPITQTFFKTTFITALFFCLAIACSTTDDAQPGGTDNIATIDGKAFNATDTKATNTGTGLSINLKDGTKEIAFTTSDKVAGTYTISNTVPSGRTNATLTAVITYYDGTDFYFGASGTIVITIDASGKASGTFTTSVKTAAGKTMELKDGKFTTLTLGSTPAGKCLISKVTSDGESPTLLEYDGDGRLIKFLSSDGPTYTEQTNYFYSGGVMTNASRTTVNGTKTTTYQEKWTYTSGKVSKIERSSNSSGTMKLEDSYAFEYNSTGLVTKVTWNGTRYSNTGSGSTSTYKGVSVLEYDANSNVTKSTYTETSSFGSSTSTSVYSNYDNKTNFYSVVAQSLGATNQVFQVYEMVGSEFSKNNPGKEVHTSGSGANIYTYTDTYTYEYNAKGFPTKVTDSACSPTCETHVDKVEYVGCN